MPEILSRALALLAGMALMLFVGASAIAQTAGDDATTQTSGEDAAAEASSEDGTQPADEAEAVELSEDELLTTEELEQLVAPIALYQDALLSQVLMASTYPLEVVEADRWVKANPDVKDEALEEAMAEMNWDPSIMALTAFPSVLDMMNAELSWTQQLGDAFLAQEEDVLAAVQSLRQLAQDAGNLESNENIIYEEEDVTTESGSTTTVITAEPAKAEVVYVPTYDPTVVYGTWPYSAYPPYYYYPPGYNAARGLFWFSVGYAVGRNWWGGCNWGSNKVNINVNVYNNNRYTKNKIKNSDWRHNPKHRRAVPYRNDKVAKRHGAKTRDTKARQNYRGKTSASNQPRKKQPDQALKKQKRQSAAKNPGKAATKPAAKQPARKQTQKKAQPRKSTKQSAYKGAGKGGSVKKQSSRGKKSRSGGGKKRRR